MINLRPGCVDPHSDLIEQMPSEIRTEIFNFVTDNASLANYAVDSAFCLGTVFTVAIDRFPLSTKLGDLEPFNTRLAKVKRFCEIKFPYKNSRTLQWERAQCWSIRVAAKIINWARSGFSMLRHCREFYRLCQTFEKERAPFVFVSSESCWEDYKSYSTDTFHRMSFFNYFSPFNRGGFVKENAAKAIKLLLDKQQESHLENLLIQEQDSAIMDLFGGKEEYEKLPELSDAISCYRDYLIDVEEIRQMICDLNKPFARGVDSAGRPFFCLKTDEFFIIFHRRYTHTHRWVCDLRGVGKRFEETSFKINGIDIIPLQEYLDSGFDIDDKDISKRLTVQRHLQDLKTIIQFMMANSSARQ